MTKDKDEKAVIRARMARTGESYAAARAQLARGGDSAEPGDAESDVNPAAPPPSRASLTATPAVSRAIQQAGGQTAWHLVLSLRSAGGVAGRVLAEIGFATDVEAPTAERQSPAAQSLHAALWAAAELKGSGPQVDTGMLLRGAVDVLDQAEVPAQHAHLVELLRGADLVSLCAVARGQLDPDDDDLIKPGAVGLFTRFTDRARKVVVHAQEEARGLDHNWIGTEHLLLGVLREGDGVGGLVLAARGVHLEATRSKVLEVIGRGEEPPSGHIPFTPRGKTVLELTLDISTELQHDYIGTEHLLLALVDEGEGVAAQLLREVGCTADVVRTDVLAMLPEA